jgi:hypothetical protein
VSALCCVHPLTYRIGKRRHCAALERAGGIGRESLVLLKLLLPLLLCYCCCLQLLLLLLLSCCCCCLQLLLLLLQPTQNYAIITANTTFAYPLLVHPPKKHNLGTLLLESARSLSAADVNAVLLTHTLSLSHVTHPCERSSQRPLLNG